jgi:hypothetical protein
VQFIVLPNLDKSGQLVLSGIAEITDVLENLLVKSVTVTVHAARDVGVIMSSLENREERRACDVYTEAVAVLTATFKHSNIQRQMINESKLFHEVDRKNRGWVRSVRDTQSVYWIAVPF